MTGHVRGAAQVVGRARRDIAKDDLLGDPAAEQHVEAVEQLRARHEIAILGRRLLRVAERGDATRDDRDLVHAIGVRPQLRDDGVARLVVGHDLLLARADQPGPALEPAHHAVDRLVEVGHLDGVLVGPGGAEGGLVDEVGQVGAHEPRRARRNRRQIDARRQRDPARVNAQDHLPTLQIGPVHDHLAVEAAGPEQRGIEDLRPIGGGHDDDALARVEAVELGQELIEGLLALVVPAESGRDPARLAERVQLVDEHDAGRLGLRLLEEIAHAGGADADEHLDEIGSAQAEERHLGLAGHRLGQERLARAGSADEQDALRDLPSEAAIPLGPPEKVHDLHQLATRLVDTRHVVEGDAGAGLDIDLGPALPDGEKAALRVAHAAHQERPQPDEHQRGHDPPEQGGEPGVLHGARELHVRRFEVGDESRIVDARGDELMNAVPIALQLVELLLRKQSFQPVGGERAADDLLGDHEIGDLALRHQ